MGEVAAEPAPELTQEQLTAAQNTLLDRAAGELAALRHAIDGAVLSQGELIEFMAGLRRLADFQGELRELRAEGRKRLARGTLAQAWGIMQPELVAAAPEPERRRSRHAAPKARVPAEGRRLRALRVLIPAGAAAFAAKAWAAKRVTGLALAAAIGAPVVTAAGVHLAQGPPPVRAVLAPALSSSAPAAAPVVTSSRSPAAKPAAATSSPVPADGPFLSPDPASAAASASPSPGSGVTVSAGPVASSEVTVAPGPEVSAQVSLPPIAGLLPLPLPLRLSAG